MISVRLRAFSVTFASEKQHTGTVAATLFLRKRASYRYQSTSSTATSVRHHSQTKGISPESVGVSRETLNRAIVDIESFVSAGKLPYARLLIHRRGKLVCHATIDSMEHPVLPQDETKADACISRWFSSSKNFAGAAFGAFLEKHPEVKLDDHVADFLGGKWANQTVFSDAEGKTQVPVKRPTTLRDLMTHTSGLTYGGLCYWQNPLPPTDLAMIGNGVGFGALVTPEGFDAWCANIGSLEKHVEIMGSIPLKFQPGSSFEYAPGMVVVGRVIEVVSGMSLKDFYREYLLDPLGCSTECGWLPNAHDESSASSVDSGGLLPLATFNPVAQGIEAATYGPQHMHVHAGFRKLDAAIFPDLQMVGQVSDLLKLGVMITGSGVSDTCADPSRQGRRVLSPATVDLITSNCLPKAQTLDWNLDRVDGWGPAIAELTASQEGSLGFGLHGLVYGASSNRQLGTVAASPGAWAWSGSALTHLVCDRRRDLTIVFESQMLTYSLVREMWPLGSLMERVFESVLE